MASGDEFTPIFGCPEPDRMMVTARRIPARVDRIDRASMIPAVPIEYVKLDDGYQEQRPSAPLRRFVECYWRRPADSMSRSHTVTPDGCVDILLSSGKNAPGSLDLVGLMTQSRIVRIGPGQEYFGVRFQPGMASEFVPDAPHVTNQIVPLAEFWGSASYSLAGRLAACPSFEAKSEVMNEVLRPVNRAESGLRAIQQLAAVPRSLDALAGAIGLSTRQLRRICVERAGVPPKLLSRILRFRKAIERIRKLHGICPDWARFALESGYFDQAHMIREFREFSGFTPGRYLQYAGRCSP